MTTMNKKSAAFLAALDDNPQPAVAPRHVPSPGIAATADVTPEPIAVLRARLGLDNSQLIQLAVNELYKKHNAQRAFGDVNR